MQSLLIRKRQSKFLRECTIAVFSLTCVFCFGTTLSWPLHARYIFRRENDFGFLVPSNQWVFVATCLPLGATICCLPVGSLVAHHGCKFVMYLQTLPYIVSWLILINMSNIYLMCFGRFLQGMCGAVVFVTIPVYTLETCRHRGTIGCLFFGALIYGSFLTYYLTEIYDIQTASKVNLFLVLMNLCLLPLPESPSHYVLHDNIQKAEESLGWIYGRNNTDEELAELLILWADKEQYKNGIWQTLRESRDAKRGLIRAAILALLNHLCGGLFFFIDHDDLLHCLSEARISHYGYGIYIAMSCGHLVCFLLIDRIGRRPLILISSMPMFFSAVLLTFWFEWPGHSRLWGHYPYNCLLTYTAFFAIGIGPMTLILSMELLLPLVRVSGNSIIALICWLLFTITHTSFELYDVGHMVYLAMFVGATLSFTYTLLFLPETKSVSLERIQRRLVPSLDALESSTTSSSESFSEFD